ncbi:unnamed protein product [Tuber melanosporum]|uniref:(Perigord truffle) hypothetical protein n=1 Tax=Tuber melanosporum (strain Mel28) TaxID=656061 RepID=D5GJL7_TUBMM|nr:uncharacterized protein GSTUM_00009068001 [Tuber melanosporum]CAZ84710.1 unnamed protein product [Tuber melanosporum]
MSRPSSTSSLPSYASILNNRRSSPGVSNFIGSRSRPSYKNHNASRQPPTSPPPPPIASSAPPVPPAQVTATELATMEEYYEAESDSRSNTPRPVRSTDFRQILEGSEYDVFEEDTTSLDESTIKYEDDNRISLVGDSPAPWRGGDERPRSNSGKSGKEKVVNTELRLWENASGDEYYEDGDEEGGFDDAGEYADDSQGGDGDGRLQGEEEVVVDDLGGIWESGSPTISSRGWPEQKSREKEGRGAVLSYRNGRPESRESMLGKDQEDRLHSYRPQRREPAPERQAKAAEQNKSPSQDRNADFTPLIPDSELTAIASYQDLISALSSLRSASYASIPQTQLPTEITELANSYYPHDTSKPSNFFKKLDDKQHAAVGDFILSKKRETEILLADCVTKRRAMVEGMKEEVEKVAEVRVKKLRMTEERREVLRGGIGKVLRESGLIL